MRLTNTPTGDGGSYEKPKPGKYIGVLVGFADVGTQPGGLYDPKPAVLLRWELHKRRGPSLDSAGHPHTITQKYGATIRGQNSRLKAALAAHGIEIGPNESTDSHDWLGKAAWLDLEPSEDQKYINVGGLSKLDPDDDAVPNPSIPLEHWEGADAEPPPAWTHFWIGRSTDLAHRLPGGVAPSGGGSTRNGSASAVPVGAPAAGDDDDPIPF